MPLTTAPRSRMSGRRRVIVLPPGSSVTSRQETESDATAVVMRSPVR